MTDEIDRVLAACHSGELPPNVALMRLFACTADEADARHRLDLARAAAGPRAAGLDAMASHWATMPAAFARIRGVLDAAAHDRPGAGAAATVASAAAVFDRLSRADPDDAMALYALGDPAILRAATGEIVGLLERRSLLSAGATVLDLGCGTGRVAAALAGRVKMVVGTDVSRGMLLEARRRSPGLSLVAGDGLGLAPFRDAVFDLVLAVDVMPYAVAAGDDLAARLLGEAARVLRPGGTVVIFNWSYGQAGSSPSPAAAQARLRPLFGPERPFRLWDATVWAYRATLRDDP